MEKRGEYDGVKRWKGKKIKEGGESGKSCKWKEVNEVNGESDGVQCWCKFPGDETEEYTSKKD